MVGKKIIPQSKSVSVRKTMDFLATLDLVVFIPPWNSTCLTGGLEITLDWPLVSPSQPLCWIPSLTCSVEFLNPMTQSAPELGAVSLCLLPVPPAQTPAHWMPSCPFLTAMSFNARRTVLTALSSPSLLLPTHAPSQTGSSPILCLTRDPVPSPLLRLGFFFF